MERKTAVFSTEASSLGLLNALWSKKEHEMAFSRFYCYSLSSTRKSSPEPAQSNTLYLSENGNLHVSGTSTRLRMHTGCTQSSRGNPVYFRSY